MGNDVATQASMMAAKTKISGALSSVEETLGGGGTKGANSRQIPKTTQREWNNMHKETLEL
jgi:hypothetical protein